MEINYENTDITCPGFCLTLTAAQAADLSSRRASSITTAPASSWTGFYLGAFGGGVFGGRTYFDNIGQDAGLNSISGVLIGLQGGYDFQSGNMVYGAALDVAYSSAEQTVVGTAATAAFLTPGASSTINIPFQASARLRAGYLLTPDWLLYATGGLAFGSTRNRTNVPTDISATSLGWTLGVGTEYKITSNWSASLEYRYLTLGTITPGAWTNLGAGVVVVGNVYPTAHTVRLGVNYRF